MKRTFSILIFLGISLFSTYAQRFSHDFGKTSNEDFGTTKCPIDSTAEAFYIYDIGECSFLREDDGFNITFERRFKIKVINKAGIKFSEFEIPFYVSDRGVENIIELEGSTFNFENGKLSKSDLKTDQFYDEKHSDHWMGRKFAMPDVKEGSVIEVRYKISSPYLFNYRSWEFQQRIPVLYSEYTAKMVPFYEYIYIAQGVKKFDEFKTYVENGIKDRLGSFEYNKKVYNFVMKNLPAFKDVDFITSPDDYLVKLDFQLAVIHHTNGFNQPIMTTWPKLVEDLLENEYFGKFLKASGKSAKAVTDTMGLTLLSPTDRAKVITNYVRNNFNWNGQVSKFTNQTFKEFFKVKKGNSAEINLYLSGLLQASGLKAFPVIMSTRANGKIKTDYPFEKFFNYVVVEVEAGDKIILLDATEPFCSFGELPSRCINDKGLIINKEKVDWVTYSPLLISSVADSFDIKFSAAKDSILISGQVSATGYNAIEARKSSLLSNIDLRKTLNINHLTLTDSITMLNQLNTELPFRLEFKANMITESVDNKIVIDPFCEVAMATNPFTQSSRQYPVDITFKKSKKYTSVLHIPDGYSVISTPKNIKVSNSLLEIVYQTEILNGNTLKVNALYTFKNDIYDSNYYLSLKGLVSILVEKFNEKIILEKSK